MPKISVVIGTSRPGGIDVTLKGMADQTYDDFEIIFVDGRYHQRHREVLKLAKEMGIKVPFYHVPNHRYNDIWPVNCGGYNTGFMLSEGEIVIMLLDYAYTPPGWIENHLKYHDRKMLVMAPHVYLGMPEVVTLDGARPAQFLFAEPQTTVDNILRQKANFTEISIFKSMFEPSWIADLPQPSDNDPKLNVVGPIDHSYMHTKNDSFPLETVLDINGMDENYDRGRGPGDTEFGYRLICAGCGPCIVQEARVYCLNPRGIMPNLNLCLPETGADIEGRWSYEHGYAYMETRRIEMSAGEPIRAKNPYDLRRRRRDIWNWRELSQDYEAIIPYINVSNEGWF